MVGRRVERTRLLLMAVLGWAGGRLKNSKTAHPWLRATGTCSAHALSCATVTGELAIWEEQKLTPMLLEATDGTQA